MRLITLCARLLRVMFAAFMQPFSFLRALILIPDYLRGVSLQLPKIEGEELPIKSSPLYEHFQQNLEGPGIWKWTHYFEVYHHHFQRFRNTPLKLVEIGIYSGGSLPMWRSYFGNDCTVLGIDIEPACESYSSDGIEVFIGDQESPAFWNEFRKIVGSFDLVIDDGGHTPGQQIVTLEQTLPYLSPGGVFVCEDVCGLSHRFTAFASALVQRLNAAENRSAEGLGYSTTNLQRMVHSIHFYPFMCVIEKHPLPRTKLMAPRHGTEWQPFL